MITDKLVTYISFAKKSGSLYIGFDAVKTSILLKKSKLVLLLDDISIKTKKEIQRISDINNIKCVSLPLKSKDFTHIFYKKVVVISITDQNLSSAILQLTN